MSRTEARILAVIVVVLVLMVFCGVAVAQVIVARRRRRTNGGSGDSQNGPPGGPRTGLPGGSPGDSSPFGSEADGPAKKLGSLLGRAAAHAEELARPAIAAVQKAAKDAARAADAALTNARNRQGKKPASVWHWGGFDSSPGKKWHWGGFGSPLDAKIETFGPGGREQPPLPDPIPSPKPPSGVRVPPVEVFGPGGSRPPVTPASEPRPAPSPQPLPPEDLGPIDEKRAAADLADEGWHVLKDADVYGPMRLPELRTRLKDLGPQTPIWVKGYRTWVAAVTVPGLLAN